MFGFHPMIFSTSQSPRLAIPFSPDNSCDHTTMKACGAFFPRPTESCSDRKLQYIISPVLTGAVKNGCLVPFVTTTSNQCFFLFNFLLLYMYPDVCYCSILGVFTFSLFLLHSLKAFDLKTLNSSHKRAKQS